MINMDDKILKKLYIEETLKTRRYMGFRLDIALIKSIITMIILTILYLYTEDIVFSIIVGLQVFLILTLLNKMTIDKKIKVGREKLSQRIKKDKFKNKIFYSDYNEFENYIMLYLNQYRYKDIQKIRDYYYSSVKNGEVVYIHLIKFYEDACVEKIDIRNLLTVLMTEKNSKSVIIAINDLSEEAKEMLEKFKSKISFELINFDDLYNFADKNSLLSEAYEYKDIENLDKKIHKKTSDIIGNIFINKKVIIYLLASALFYAMYRFILHNKLGLYISYYFIILTVINVSYNIYKTYAKKRI